MIQSALDRRTFLAFGLASGWLCTPGGFDAHAAPPAGRIILKPFAHSRTVSSFANCLLSYEDAMPLWFRRAIEAELARTDMVREALAQERKCAAFFAQLAVAYLAPVALHRAGYEQMAVDVANGALCPAGAQHTIGRRHAQGEPRPRPRLESCAYGASACASMAEFYAGHEDIGVIAEAGHYCANALLDGSFYDDDVVVTDAAWIWNFAAMAINTAIGLSWHDGSSGSAQKVGLSSSRPSAMPPAHGE